MERQVFDDVWDALEETPGDAANMTMRSNLLIAIEREVRSWNMTQSDAASRIGISQPRLNDLLKGKITEFSFDALAEIAGRTGLTVQSAVLAGYGDLAAGRVFASTDDFDADMEILEQGSRWLAVSNHRSVKLVACHRPSTDANGGKQGNHMPKRTLSIPTADGNCPAGFFGPEGKSSGPAIILYMDAFGPRPALDAMAERLVGLGYAVLVPDLFYRFGAYGPHDPMTAFSDPEIGQKIRQMLGATTQAMTASDTGAFLETLAKEGYSGNVGTVGYCMGGGRAINAAAHYPERIVAAASFHGGNLANDAPDCPAANAAKIKAHVYVGVAGVDGSFPPEQSAKLAQAFREAEVDHIVENYAGMKHGWCVPDHSVYDESGSERHWKRLETLFGETLQV